MEDLPNTQEEISLNPPKHKNYLLQIVAVIAIFICVGTVFLCQIKVKESNLLLAKSVEGKEKEEVLGVFYKRPEIIPQKVDGAADLNVSATSAIIIDADTFTVLYEKNADEQRAMASTTKIMTALVALREFSPTRVIEIDDEDIAVGGSSMFLLSGESFRLEDLIKGLLIPSGNDVALTLENEFKNYGKDIVEEMNAYAKALGLANTHFMNTSGLDADGHYSSARDLAVIANYAMMNYTIKSAVSLSEDTVYSTDGVHGHYLVSTNELLGTVDGVDGIKTGSTQNAGQCLISSAERNGHRIITVVLDSPNRFVETEEMIDWAFENYSWDM